MHNFFTRFISFLLIFNLLFLRGFSAVPQVFGQSEPAPTSAPAPTTPPKEAKPPSDPQPSSPPQTATFPPTTAPAPTSPASPTSPSTDSNPSPTSSDESSTSSDPAGSEISQSGSDASSTTDQAAPPEGEKEGGVNDPANIGTGPLSDNFAQEINNKVQNIVNTNLAQMENKLAALSSTGFNYANLNTLDGQVVTGDALATLNLLNKLNSNMTGVGGFAVYNVYDNFYGDIVFQLPKLASGFTSATSTVSKNSVTGPNSNNIADAQNSFTVNEASGNDATLVNDLVLEAVSGGNSASFNTGGGSIKTGNAASLANVINMVNTNLNVSQWLVGVVNVFGTLAGNIILPQDESGPPVENNTTFLAENSNTGFGSTNNVTVDIEKSTEVTNNNEADIQTNLEVTANSGDNTANINTGGGGITTGQSDVSVSNTTVANSNTVKEEETVWMVIVNEMGKWVGHIIGAPWESNIASNGLPLVNQTSGVPEQSYSVLAQNTGTGPLSNNEASYSETDETTIANNNTAGIVNNVKASSDTGNNDTSYNTGAGVIDTGNAKTGVNLVNMVNTNVVAKKFVTILVNVLGEFLGNIITPSQNYQSPLANANQNSNSQVNSTTTPTPTISQVASSSQTSNVNGGIGGTTDNSYSQQNIIYDSLSFNTISADYNQSILLVNQTKKQIKAKVNNLASLSYPAYNLNDQRNLPPRGLFLSPAFAKATETSIAGMLFGGSSIKVTSSWLSVLPLAIIIVLLRRRKKFNLTKYLNLFLELVL